MSQFRDKSDKTINQRIEDAENPASKEPSTDLENQINKNLEIAADAFKDPDYARRVYSGLSREYNIKLAPKFNRINREKSKFPPFWDEVKNQPIELPLYQHNESSGRYRHTLKQSSLPYNSFFPNQSYANTLIDVSIIEESFSREESIEPKHHDESRLIEQAFDNVVRFSKWAKKQHLHLVGQVLNYGFGVYYFNKGDSYTYKSLDVRKCRFPVGTSVCPDEWEYMFFEHDMSFSDIIKEFNKASPDSKSGWHKENLKELLSQIISHNTVSNDDKSTYSALIDNLDDVKEGLGNCNFEKVCTARIPVVSRFSKDENDNVTTSIFVASTSYLAFDRYLYQKDTKRTFSEMFTVFPYDYTELEIRMQNGLGSDIFSLCHAYERSFSRFLDAVDYATTLYLSMDTSDIHKELIYMGSVNIGKIDSIQKFPDSLSSVISSLAFLDAKIEQITSTRGLNKTEAFGNHKGEELSNTLLTTEGRIKKHETDRFIDTYTEHLSKVMARILFICNKTSRHSLYPEVKTKFYDFLINRGLNKEDLKLDDTSSLNCGLPSNWMLQAKKPDGMGIRPSSQRILKDIEPYLSSLPEEAFRKVLAMAVGDAFGDEDVMNAILSDTELKSAVSEADQQIAEMQVLELTSEKSDFDFDVDFSGEVAPELSDAPKFNTLNAFKINDSIVFLEIILAKLDDVKSRFQRKEIGITTLHIWTFNLISTAQNHVELLRSDNIRSKRAEVKNLFAKFGEEFNELRRIEQRANQARDRRIEELQTKLQQQELDDPKRVEAQAKLITAQAKMTEVREKYSSTSIDNQVKIAENARAEQAGAVDRATKTQAIRINDAEFASQSLVGRPGANEQRGA